MQNIIYSSFPLNPTMIITIFYHLSLYHHYYNYLIPLSKELLQPFFTIIVSSRPFWLQGLLLPRPRRLQNTTTRADTGDSIEDKHARDRRVEIHFERVDCAFPTGGAVEGGGWERGGRWREVTILGRGESKR